MSFGKSHRMTRQRMVILEELRRMNSHPTADEVYEVVRKRLPRISLGTVYRNLEILSGMGLIQKLEMDSAQKRFDGNPERHYHLRCMVCNRIVDVPGDVLRRIDYSPESCGDCRILDFHLHFLGVCDECQRKGLRPGDGVTGGGPGRIDSNQLQDRRET